MSLKVFMLITVSFIIGSRHIKMKTYYEIKHVNNRVRSVVEGNAVPLGKGFI